MIFSVLPEYVSIALTNDSIQTPYESWSIGPMYSEQGLHISSKHIRVLKLNGLSYYQIMSTNRV